MCLRAKQVMAVTTGRHFTPMPASGSRPETIDRVLSVRIAAASANPDPALMANFGSGCGLKAGQRTSASGLSRRRLQFRCEAAIASGAQPEPRGGSRGMRVGLDPAPTLMSAPFVRTQLRSGVPSVSQSRAFIVSPSLNRRTSGESSALAAVAAVRSNGAPETRASRSI